MLSKELQIPLHHQIYTDILSKIEDGTYSVNEKLPSEPELQEMYSVSRITVRRAMHDLQKDGYAKKQRGIGTVVCKPSRKFNLQRLSSFSEDIESYGEKSSSILVSFDEVIPDNYISTMLDMEDDEKAYMIERLRLSGDVVIGLHIAYIKMSERIKLKKDDFKPETSLYKLLKEQGIKLNHATETLEARMPDSELQKRLQIDKMQPIFYKERTTYDFDENPIEYVKIYYRADMYQYNVVLDLSEGRE